MEICLLVFFIILYRYVTYQSRYAKPIYVLTGIIGVPVHEFGHYILCKIFCFKVTNVVWFQLPKNGCGGYVEYLSKPTVFSAFLRLLIAIGPLFSGALAISIISMVYSYPIPHTHSEFQYFVSTNMEDLSIKWISYIWLVSSIMLHTLPSLTDIKQAFSGSALLVIIISLSSTFGLTFYLLQIYDLMMPVLTATKTYLTFAVSIYAPFFIFILTAQFAHFFIFRGKQLFK